MKVLLDTCVWGGALKHLVAAGLDLLSTPFLGKNRSILLYNISGN